MDAFCSMCSLCKGRGLFWYCEGLGRSARREHSA